MTCQRISSVFERVFISESQVLCSDIQYKLLFPKSEYYESNYHTKKEILSHVNNVYILFPYGLDCIILQTMGVFCCLSHIEVISDCPVICVRVCSSLFRIFPLWEYLLYSEKGLLLVEKRGGLARFNS